jgi:hypothetical protein
LALEWIAAGMEERDDQQGAAFNGEKQRVRKTP